MYERYWMPTAPQVTAKEAQRWVLLLPDSVRAKYTTRVVIPRLAALGESPVPWLPVLTEEQVRKMFSDFLASVSTLSELQEATHWLKPCSAPMQSIMTQMLEQRASHLLDKHANPSDPHSITPFLTLKLPSEQAILAQIVMPKLL